LESDYLVHTRNLIADILESTQFNILGFSVGHDIPILEQFVGRPLQPTMLLDLQLILAPGNDPSRLPSLKTCAALYSQVPLCKQQQCSDWGQRPLTLAQQNYAGLDAAVLLYLLAEYLAANSDAFTKTKT
jgi:ribonuclease D